MKNLKLNYFLILSVSFLISCPLIYFLSNYKSSIVALIILPFVLGFLFLVVYEYTNRIDLFFSFAIIFASFYGFSSLPANYYFEHYNYIFLCLLYIILLTVKQFSEFNSNLVLKYSVYDKTLLLAFFVFFIVSVFINSNDLFTVFGFSKILLLLLSAYLFCNYIPNSLMQNKKLLEIFLKSLIYFGIVSGTYGLLTMVSVSFNANNINPGTAISFFKHPNATSSIYNFTIPPALYFLFFKKDRISQSEKIIFFSGILLMIFNLLFTFSRSGILSIGIVFLIMTYSYSKKLFYSSVILLPIIIIFSISTFFTSKGAGTAIGRLGLLATTIEMFNSSRTGTLWGFGTLSAETIFEKIKISLNVPDENNVPHNVFVYFILQFGLITAIPLFIFFFKTVFKSIIRNFKTDNHILTLSIAICLSLVVKNLAEDLLFFPEFIIFHLFLIFFGFMVIITNRNYRSDNFESTVH